MATRVMNSSPGQVEYWRLFIALEVPEPVKDRIEQAQRALRDACRRADVRWTRREQFHLTLRFLGQVEATRAEALAVALRSATAEIRALQLTAGKIGFFPGAHRPRVVWAGLDGGSGLLTLQQAVAIAAAPYTSEPAEKEFSGHITLARIREIRGGDARALEAAAVRLADEVFGSWTATRVDVIRSRLSPEGARYSSIAEIPLAS